MENQKKQIWCIANKKKSYLDEKYTVVKNIKKHQTKYKVNYKSLTVSNGSSIVPELNTLEINGGLKCVSTNDGMEFKFNITSDPDGGNSKNVRLSNWEIEMLYAFLKVYDSAANKGEEILGDEWGEPSRIH